MSYRVELRFAPGRQPVIGSWPSKTVAQDKYTEYTQRYGTNPETTVRLIDEDADGGEQVLREWGARP